MPSGLLPNIYGQCGRHQQLGRPDASLGSFTQAKRALTRAEQAPIQRTRMMVTTGRV